MTTGTPRAHAALGGSGAANGPEGDPTDWQSIDWHKAEGEVRRLRQRIFTASQAGDLKKVRNLQKLMLRSRSNTLLSVRRVTEINAGRKTAGVDGRVVLLPQGKAELADWMQHRAALWKPRPVKRVFVPKANRRRRGLGIPVIIDRCLQAVAVNALEPEWEARFEPRSYGFRPGRGCHDAIGVIFLAVKGKNPRRQWILDADLAAAFDRIDHDRLLAALGHFPARELVKQWLTAGVLDRGRLSPTEEGVPQGGIISPVLMNVALHGMEEAAGVRYQLTGVGVGELKEGSPTLVRYADDLVTLCHSRGEAEQVKERLAGWLAPRGLAFNEDKTRIVHLDEGCDFLGFTIRRYHGVLLIKPSKAAVRRIRARLTAEVRALRGQNATAVIAKLNPIIRGWAAYYRGVVSSEIFTALDNHVWKLVYKWARHTHPNKPRGWVAAQYFGRFNRSRQDRWVFGDRASGRYLTKFSWTKIVRHQLVAKGASVDDPALADYWASRRRRNKPPLSPYGLRLLQAQHGRCSLCGDLLPHADRQPQSPQEWEQWLRAIRMAVRSNALTLTPDGDQSDDHVASQLIHTHCHRRHGGRGPAILGAS
ncbi:group II intron reverse transcriptase/maturase [Streptomyces chartreusis]|uniref:group II intron reverse transcriptase/maturase n=1 Tax=Streptomyces chartreusis TaxID=1969 RepID=UPI002F910FB4|nr:group II intron reverse transcriptase/maturase [Streptomyces chartreusis]